MAANTEVLFAKILQNLPSSISVIILDLESCYLPFLSNKQFSNALESIFLGLVIESFNSFYWRKLQPPSSSVKNVHEATSKIRWSTRALHKCNSVIHIENYMIFLYRRRVSPIASFEILIFSHRPVNSDLRERGDPLSKIVTQRK